MKMKCRFRLFAGMLVLGAMIVGCDSANQAAPSESEPTATSSAPSAEEAATNAVQATKAVEAVAKVDKAEVATRSAVEMASQTASICKLTGSAGTTVDCAIKLAVGDTGIAARALQGTLNYDSGSAQFVGLFDQFCPSEGNCVAKEINAQSPALSRTGHTMSMAPKSAAEWAGKGSFLLANLTNPTASLSDARVGTEAASKGIFTARFTLSRDASEANPVMVDISGVVAADEAANEVAVSVANSTLVTGQAITR
jgi:hypothetical protein